MKSFLFSSLLIMTLVGAACGSSEPAPAAAPPSGNTGAASSDGRAIEIAANDAIKFSVTEITAAPGERLRVVLTNKGNMPKISMGHNFVLLDVTADVPAFATAAALSPATEYVPPALKDKVVAASKVLGPGESDTITFTVPTAPGRYEFICSFPGHFQAGMRGVLIVQ